MRAVLRSTALAAALFGCALVPTTNPRLEEAKAAIDGLSAIPESRRLAPREVEQATEALRRAVEAWDSLQDAALVDHLAYLAKQRAAIARATIQRIGAAQEDSTRAGFPK